MSSNKNGAINLPLEVIKFSGNIRNKDRFSIILLDQDIIRISVKSKTFFLQNFTIVFLKPEEELKIESRARNISWCLSFHPSVIDNAFNFENLNDKNNFNDVSLLNLYWLRPFTENNPGQNLIETGPVIFNGLLDKFQILEDELQQTDDPYHPCRCRSCLLEILQLVMKIYEKQGHKIKSQFENDELIYRIIDYIHVNFLARLTIDSIVKKFETNRTTLNNRFSEATGKTIIPYINGLRLANAAVLLRETKLPVVDILYRSGFEDPSYFGRLFKNEYQLTPSQYRLQNSIEKSN